MTGDHSRAAREAIEHMRTVVEQGAADTDAMLERLGSIRDEIATIQQEIADERAREAEERAEDEARARRGELGPAPQELQQRLDRRETTMAAVISGADTHWSALEFRRTVVTNMRQMIDELEENDPKFAARYRSAATLREGQDIGQWPDLDGPGEVPPSRPGGGAW